jgi:hypothetical protein
MEPFFTTKPKGKGTGLGLSMAKGFAEQSGGALSDRERAWARHTVTLWLPEVAAMRGAGARPGPAQRFAQPSRPMRAACSSSTTMSRCATA